jgi:hypothetical protein
MLALVAALLIPPPGPAAADLVLVNGHPGGAFTSAALGGGQVLTTDPDQVARWRTTARRVIDLGGRRVLPGFVDSHVHLLGGGLQLARVELKDAADEAEFGRRLKAFDAKLPRDRWMLGGNWDHDRTFAGILPTAATVDRYVPDRPVFLRRYDGHMALANSAALRLAKIDAATKEVAGGVVYRLADGRTPSGVLKDNAMGLLDALIPEPDDAEIAEAVRAALKLAASVGVTAVQDMEGSSPVTRRKLVTVLERLAKSGELTCRVAVRWPISLYKDAAAATIDDGHGGAFVRVGGVKGFMDGSLGSSTAKMFEPFLNEQTTGVYVTEPAVMRGLIRGATAAGLSVAVHAIGDRANAELLDLFAEAGKPAAVGRFRIEHAQHLRPADYARFKLGGVVASVQPYHVADDGRWAVGRIGPDRVKSSYAFRSLLDAGATVAFGSDWPVAPLDPLPGLDAAVNRRTLDGKYPRGWVPEQRITVGEAVTAYTVTGRAAGGWAEAADFVVLDRDILDGSEPGRIGEAKVVLTVVGGRVAFERK